jgi:hypothetical protein
MSASASSRLLQAEMRDTRPSRTPSWPVNPAPLAVDDSTSGWSSGIALPGPDSR